ncbi:MAG TPA: hypothetical protein VGB63_05925 [Pedobacter sp.]|jgi:hypothetical protein
MLQTSTTTDSEFNLFPVAEMEPTPSSSLNAEDQTFYNTIKRELNKISYSPSQEAVDKILSYSKSV